MARAKSPSSAQSTATIGFEAKRPVWKDITADKLRNNMDEAVTERSDKRWPSPEPLIRGIDFNFGKTPDDTFLADQQPDLRADY